jgi:hypothetical protein
MWIDLIHLNLKQCMEAKACTKFTLSQMKTPPFANIVNYPACVLDVLITTLTTIVFIMKMSLTGP